MPTSHSRFIVYANVEASSTTIYHSVACDSRSQAHIAVAFFELIGLKGKILEVPGGAPVFLVSLFRDEDSPESYRQPMTLQVLRDALEEEIEAAPHLEAKFEALVAGTLLEVDNDYFSVLLYPEKELKFKGRDSGFEARAAQAETERRRMVAEAEFEKYNFDAQVEATDGWEYTTPFPEFFSRNVYLENAEEAGASRRVIFHVQFREDGTVWNCGWMEAPVATVS